MGLLLLALPFVVAVLALPRLVRASKQLQRVEAVGRGMCPECRYDLTGGIEANCQECGYAFTRRELQRLNRIAPALKKKRDMA